MPKWWRCNSGAETATPRCQRPSIRCLSRVPDHNTTIWPYVHKHDTEDELRKCLCMCACMCVPVCVPECVYLSEWINYDLVAQGLCYKFHYISIFIIIINIKITIAITDTIVVAVTIILFCSHYHCHYFCHYHYIYLYQYH